MTALADFAVFHDQKLAAKYANRRIPMATLYEAYFDGAVDLPGDIYRFLAERHKLVSFVLTPAHLKWAVTNFIPEVVIHSKAQDERIVREHYDRGDDFFGWFLGDRMAYTSAFFMNTEETLEQAQDNKFNLVCQKLALKPGERLLDVGCGWGSLACHAARYYGVEATAVTIAKNQAAFAERRAKELGVADRVRVLCTDYRDIPKEKYDKIVSLEMVEHVGVKNLHAFFRQMGDLLKDNGLFVLQWAGPRRGILSRPEDLIWGLFMNKYVFPGADASLCPSAMVAASEKCGWEMHSMENVSHHYGWTIKRWHDNWLRNQEAVRAAYGERWFRIWNLFLSWSTLVAAQGTSACFQSVLNKNIATFDRTRWIGANHVLGDRMPRIETPATIHQSIAAAE